MTLGRVLKCSFQSHLIIIIIIIIIMFLIVLELVNQCEKTAESGCKGIPYVSSYDQIWREF